MKKIVSLAMAGVMLLGACPMVYAAEADKQTTVTYNAANVNVDIDGDGVYDNTEHYTVTVPAEMAPGASAKVTYSGSWASNRKLVVTSDATVTLANSLDNSETRTLGITFDGIADVGSNSEIQSGSADISIADMPSDVLFGTWSGTFNYSVGMANVE